MPLRTRLTLLVVISVCLVVTAVSAYFIARHRQDQHLAVDRESAAMRKQLASKGRALARNIALSSERAILITDFLFLREVIQTTVGSDDEISYGIIMNKEGTALVHSDPDKSLSVLDDSAARFALAQTSHAQKELQWNDDPTVETIVPLTVEDKLWGFVRLGQTLRYLNVAIEQNRAQLAARMARDIITAVLVAVVFALLASLLGIVASRRIAEPLMRLRSGVRTIAAGNLDVSVDIREGSREIVDLAAAFNTMSNAVRDRDIVLRQKMDELAEALDAANEASRLKSEFVASVSHELRTPLNAVVNIPGSLMKQLTGEHVWCCARCDERFFPNEESIGTEGGHIEELCPDCGVKMTLETQQAAVDVPKLRRFLGMLQSSGRYLLSVVTDLLDFSKLEAGKLKLSPERVGVDDLFHDVQQTVLALALDKNLRLDFSGGEGVELVADPVKLSQILVNLIGNAIKFTDKGGAVDVQVRQEKRGDEDFLLFSVSDTGIGIPQDRLDAVFESFRQLDAGHTRQHGGTGLGLAITKRLVELHGGHIWIKSEVGVGSTFFFLVPAVGTICGTVEPTRSTNRKQSVALRRAGAFKRRIVLIDDDEIQLQITKMILEKEGFETFVSADAEQGLSMIGSVKPDVVVLDVMMPKMTGIQILERLKENPDTIDIPVIVCTAFHSNRDIAKRLGGVWVPKPWNAYEMVAQIQNAISAGPTNTDS